MELDLTSVIAVALLQQAGAPVPAFWLLDRLTDLGGLALLVLGAVAAVYAAYRLLDRLRTVSR
jgi:hypothetical protein